MSAVALLLKCDDGGSPSGEPQMWVNVVLDRVAIEMLDAHLEMPLLGSSEACDWSPT